MKNGHRKKKGAAADEGVRERGGVIMKSGSGLCRLAGFHSVHSFIYLGHWGIRAGFLSN